MRYPGSPCGITCLLPTHLCKMIALTFPILLGNGFSAPQFIVMSQISFLWKIAPVFYPLQCPEDRRKDYKVCKWYSLPAPPLWSDSLLKRMWLEMTDLLGSVWWWRKGGEAGVCVLVRIVQRSKLNLLLWSSCKMARQRWGTSFGDWDVNRKQGIEGCEALSLRGQPATI